MEGGQNLLDKQDKAFSLIENAQADARQAALEQEHRYAKAIGEMSDRLREQGSGFVEKIDELRQELMAALASESARLQENQACRDALTTMLTDLASRLELNKEGSDTGPSKDR